MRSQSLAVRLAAAVAVVASLAIAVPAVAQDLKIAVAADVTSIDPHFYNLFPNNNMAEHIYDKLVQMDPDSRMIPGIATSWKAIDERTWEYKLRKGVKFHDGSELTAEDVAFSIDRVPTVPNSPGLFTPYTKAIQKIEVVDPGNRAKLSTHVGQRLSVTGTLADRQMQVRSIRRISATCD